MFWHKQFIEKLYQGYIFLAQTNHSETILGVQFGYDFCSKTVPGVCFGYGFCMSKHTPGIFVRGGICLPVTPARCFFGKNI